MFYDFISFMEWLSQVSAIFKHSVYSHFPVNYHLSMRRLTHAPFTSFKEGGNDARFSVPYSSCLYPLLWGRAIRLWKEPSSKLGKENMDFLKLLIFSRLIWNLQINYKYSSESFHTPSSNLLYLVTSITREYVFTLLTSAKYIN